MRIKIKPFLLTMIKTCFTLKSDNVIFNTMEFFYQTKSQL